MERELKRGTLEMVLLALLEERERYGYELVTLLEERGGGAFRVTGGTLYPVLYRLEEAGHLEPRWETRERGAPRKYYAVTDAGREELARRREEWDAFVRAVEILMAGETGEGEET